VDFHILSVYLDSGKASEGYEHRRQAARRISQM
jgi:hypothetical protein